MRRYGINTKAIFLSAQREKTKNFKKCCQNVATLLPKALKPLITAWFGVMYGDGGSRTHVQKHRLLKRLRA